MLFLQLSSGLSPRRYHPPVMKAGIHLPSHPSPHLQQTPPCFPSVLTTLSNCCGKAGADLQRILLGPVSKQRHSLTEEAQSPSAYVTNCLYLQGVYRFQDTKYSTVYCMGCYKRLLSHQTIPFPLIQQWTLLIHGTLQTAAL